MYDYMTEIQELWPISFQMQSVGMHIDTQALIQVRKDVNTLVRSRESSLEQKLGWVPNTKSPIDMGRIFDEYKIPYELTPKSKKPKIAKTTLLLMGAKYPAIQPILAECIEITTRRTLRSNFLGMALDQNDFYHPTYRLNGTAQGRFASEGADEGGPQAQNWPIHLRNIVIADDPELDELTSADMKQAEGMFIAYDSQDIFYIRCFEQNKNVHKALGLILFHGRDTTGIPSNDDLNLVKKVCDVCQKEGLPECTHSQYFISKSSGYAFKYGMGPWKYVTKQLPPAGVFMSEAEGGRIRSKVITPALARWQAGGDTAIRQSRWQTNALGRKREFYGFLDKSGELVRELLAWWASSVVSVIVNRAMIKFDRLVSSMSPKPRIVTCTHDSLLVSHRKQFRRNVHECLQLAFDQPMTLHGRVLNIPIDLGSGPNWRATK